MGTFVAYRLYKPWRWTHYRRYASSVVPIRFYGRVVDQNGKAVAGATVRATVNTVNRRYLLNGSDPTRDVALEAVAGPDGTFTLESAGRTLRIESVAKDGYLPSPPPGWYHSGEFSEAWHYYYSPAFDPRLVYVPSATNPAVFPLRRSNELPTSQPSRGGAPGGTPVAATEVPTEAVGPPQGVPPDSQAVLQTSRGLTQSEFRRQAQAAEITGKAVEAINARIQWFRFELKYHPEDPQPASELALIVAPAADNPAAHYRAVQIPQAQARGIVDALAKDGFFVRGAMNRRKLNVLPPRPYFTLKVSAGSSETSYFEHVKGERARAQLRAVVDLLEGDARLAFQRLLELDDQEAAGAGDPTLGGEPK